MRDFLYVLLWMNGYFATVVLEFAKRPEWWVIADNSTKGFLILIPFWPAVMLTYIFA